MSELQSNCSWS